MQSGLFGKLWILVIGLGVFVCLPNAAAQDPSTQPHILHVSMVTPPAGPNSSFSMKLTISPADVDVSGFSIVIGYNNNLFTFVSAQDNTSQAAGWQYDRGDDAPLTGVPYANIYMPLVMTTSADLIEPVNLAQLNFRTTANFNDETDQVYIYLDSWPRGSQEAGVLSGFTSGPRWIPITYDSLEPVPAAVGNWHLYE